MNKNSDQQQDDTNVIAICGTEVGDDSLLSGLSGLDPDAGNSETGAVDERQGKNAANSLLFSALFSTEEDDVTNMEESAIADFELQKNFASRTDFLDFNPFNKQFACLGQLSHAKSKSGCYTTPEIGHTVTSVNSLENKNMLHSKFSNTTSSQHAKPKMISTTTSSQHAKPKMISTTTSLNNFGHQAFLNSMKESDFSQKQTSQISSQLLGVITSAFSTVTSPSNNMKLDIPKSVLTDSSSPSLDIKDSQAPSCSRLGSSVDNNSDKLKSNKSNASGKLEKQIKETKEEEPCQLSSAEKSLSPAMNGHNRSSSNMSSSGPHEFRNGSVHIMGMLPSLEDQGACGNLATDCYMAAVSDLRFAHNQQPGGGKILRKRQHEDRDIVINHSVNVIKSNIETSKEPIITSPPISISLQSNCQSSSVEKKLRYDKTAAALRQSGLMDITLKTAELLRKNASLQKELQKLKQETSLFLRSVLNNPENEAFRNFLKTAKQPVTTNIKEKKQEAQTR